MRVGVRTAGMAFVVATLVAAGCTGDGDDGSSGDSEVSDAPPVEVEVTPAGLVVTSDGDTLVDPADGNGREAPVSWRDAPYEVVSKQGDAYLGHELLSTPDDSEIPWTPVTPAPADSKAASGDTAPTTVEDVGDGVARVTVEAPDEATQLSLSFACADDERFYGFGSQTWATQHRGETVPIWVVEQGLGKITPETPLPAPSVMGEPYDSYIPIPYFFSSEGYGISLDTTNYSTFEMCTEEHPDSWRVEVWDDELSFFVFTGPEPVDLVERYTSIAGRPATVPADWFFAPMNDAVRGQENVLRVAQKIRDNDIPSSVMWTEDWIGIGSQVTGFRLSHDWDVSETEYPDLAAMTGELHEEGFRFLGYFSPFIPHEDTTPGGPSVDSDGNPIVLQPHNQEKWNEALAGDYFFHDPEGEPYLMLTPPFVNPGGAGLDLTDDEAVEWYKGWLADAEELGVDGSMTDFGEWVPFDAVFDDGRTGAEVHNEYPLLWQEANREFWDDARPDGDYLFYVRSGYTGSQQHAPAFWGGDQNTTFDRLDGLGSVVTMGTNLGLSGVSFFGSDIAGYSAFEIEGVSNVPTTKELFLRWAALGAYTPMMRTHHGSAYGENWSFEGAPDPDNPVEPIEDPETLQAWKELASTHIALYPYQKAYAEESVKRGLPIMRHLLLRYPDDPNVQRGIPEGAEWDTFAEAGRPTDEMFEYLLGDSLLVAPIVDAGATSRPVYLPEGDWYDITTGERFEGPTTVIAEAAPGEIPVFSPAGAIVPRLPDGVETLVPTEDPDVVDQTDVEDRLVVDVFLGADGTFELADGTRFELSGDHDIAGDLTVSIDGDRIRGTDDDAAHVIETGELGSADLTITGSDGGEATLSIDGAPLERTYTMRVFV